MEFNNTISVTASIDRFPKQDASINYEGIIQDKIYKEDINFEFNKIEASNFLFKFSPYIFKYKQYQVIFKYNEKGKLSSIILTDDDYIYIITNIIQFLTELHEGYFRLLTMEKVNSILEFDFNTEFIESDEIKDEFVDENGEITE